MRAIDKLSKKSSEQIINEYKGKLDSTKVCKNLFNLFPLLIDLIKYWIMIRLMEFKSSGNLQELFDSLKSRRVKNIMVDFRIVRGLDYYSGIVFEAKELSSQVGSLVGGGRYDKLTEAFGRKDLYATGAAGGVERILTAIKDKSTKVLQRPADLCCIWFQDKKKNLL